MPDSELPNSELPDTETPDSEPSNSRPPEGEPIERSRYQFSLSTLLLIMGLFSILSAALAGMLRRHMGHSAMAPGFYVIMAAAAPVALMILFSFVAAILKFFGGQRK